MTRGMPAVWSSIVAIPFIAFGVAETTGQLSVTIPSQIGMAALGIGLGIILLGFYVHLIGADSFEPAEYEQVLVQAHPRTPFVKTKAFLGIGFLSAAAYWLFYTRVPYVYPTISIFVGGTLFATGIWTYWQNTLTSYYLTDERVVTETCFLGSDDSHLHLEKIKSRRVNRPFYLRMFGLGDITLDVGDRQYYLIRHIKNSETFSEELGRLVHKKKQS